MFLKQFFILAAAFVHLALAAEDHERGKITEDLQKLNEFRELTKKLMHHLSLKGSLMMGHFSDFAFNGYDLLIKITQLDKNKDDMVKAIITCMVGYLREAVVFWKVAAMLHQNMMQTVLVANEKFDKCGDDSKCKGDVIEEVRHLFTAASGLEKTTLGHLLVLGEKLLKCQK